MDDGIFLEEAIALGREALHDDRGGPFGAVVVQGGRVIGRARNLVLESFDPTAHAEVLAIRDACLRTRSHSLRGATLYASCEPCPMCLGAIQWARVDRVVYAASRETAAAAGFDDVRFYEELAKPPELRRPASSYVPRPEAAAILHAWSRREGRTLY